MSLKVWLAKPKISAATEADFTDDKSKIEMPTCSFEMLIKYYPAIIEGCLLTDALQYIVEDDYGQLMDEEVMICLVKTLKANGKIATVATAANGHAYP